MYHRRGVWAKMTGNQLKRRLSPKLALRPNNLEEVGELLKRRLPDFTLLIRSQFLSTTTEPNITSLPSVLRSHLEQF